MNLSLLRRGLGRLAVPRLVRVQAAYTTGRPDLEILDHALAKVDSLGWTRVAVSSAASDLGYSSMAHGVAPHGGISLVGHFMDRALDDTCIEADDQLHELATPADKLRLLCRIRLRQTLPYVRRWPEAAALLAQPQNVAGALERLAELSSRMWYLAGDQSTRIDWYTRRSALAAAYVASELYMCEDRSPEHADTWRFLDERIADINSAERAGAKAVAFGSQFSRNLFNILQSQGVISKERRG
ncbi:Ubiquinone biosynthesis protein coq9, mitochondrial [Coemansia sp. RSA 2706]|nr:Ubiquinone biosynthesis protein coq9, mitochondrial [Coemansia sp. RSA 2706]